MSDRVFRRWEEYGSCIDRADASLVPDCPPEKRNSVSVRSFSFSKIDAIYCRLRRKQMYRTKIDIRRIQPDRIIPFDFSVHPFFPH